MKKTMKSISILLALMLLISGICAVPVSAADVNYSVSGASGATGDTVTVAVSVSTSIDLWGGNVSLKYNPAELQVVSCAIGGAAVAGSSVNDTGSAVNFSGMYSAKSGTVFTVSFKILLESGKSSLTLSSSENTDVDGTTHDYTVSNSSVTVSNKPSVEKITLDKTAITVKKGEKVKVSATATPSSQTSSIGFYSSDDDIATVSSDGTITAVSGGTATITAYIGDVTAKCTVNVSVPLTGIKANGNTTRNVKVGDKISLSVNKVPADATDKVTASWTSSNPQIASVKAGTVTAVAVGEATITAKVNTYTVAYKIIVTENTGESTTAESTTAEESTTDESTTVDESTTNEPITFPTTKPFTETTTLERYSLVEPTSYESNDGNDIKDSNEYMSLLIVAGAGVVAVVIGAVTFFVSRGYKGKNKKQKIIVEEKFER